MQEIEAYAARRGILPASVVQAATGHSGTTWAKWKGGATCSLRTAEKIRDYIAVNPAANAFVESSTPTPEEDAA